MLIIIGSITLGRYSFFTVFLIFTIASQFEFYRLCRKARVRAQTFYGILLGVALFTVSHLCAIGKVESFAFLGFLPLIVSVFIVELFRNNPRPIHNIGFTLLGILYIAFPMSLLNFFALNYASYRIEFSSQLLLGFFFLTWANDSGAYAIGVSMGKNKLFPSISPKKTWEGLIGGIFTTILTSWIISLFYVNIPLSQWFVIGLITATMSVFGDLVESMFKRSINVKDSGKFLPGHGGFLDRFDAILLSTPILFVYLKIAMII